MTSLVLIISNFKNVLKTFNLEIFKEFLERETDVLHIHHENMPI